uniref:ESX-1 associated ATP-binding protein EpsI N-terminal domain-containing protein n=1 Tax=Mycobacterium tuberculosis TaxID=1773 RepID=UPI001248FB0D
MAADYDKLFRPHEGMEAPDDMAAQPFFDPSASFPPAPASANLPKPNGQTPPPTSDNLSECAQTYKHEKGRDRRKVELARS